MLFTCGNSWGHGETHLKILGVSHVSKWSSSQGQSCSPSANKEDNWDTLTATWVLKWEQLQSNSQTVFSCPDTYKYGMQNDVLLQALCLQVTGWLTWSCNCNILTFPTSLRWRGDVVWMTAGAVSTSARHGSVSALSLGDQAGLARGTSRASGTVLCRYAINLR